MAAVIGLLINPVAVKKPHGIKGKQRFKATEEKDGWMKIDVSRDKQPNPHQASNWQNTKSHGNDTKDALGMGSTKRLPLQTQEELEHEVNNQNGEHETKGGQHTTDHHNTNMDLPTENLNDILMQESLVSHVTRNNVECCDQRTISREKSSDNKRERLNLDDKSAMQEIVAAPGSEPFSFHQSQKARFIHGGIMGIDENPNKKDTGSCNHNETVTMKTDAENNRTLVNIKCHSPIDTLNILAVTDKNCEVNAKDNDRDSAYESASEHSEDNQDANNEAEPTPYNSIKAGNQNIVHKHDGGETNMESGLKDNVTMEQPSHAVPELMSHNVLKVDAAVQVHFDEEHQILSSRIPSKNELQKKSHHVISAEKLSPDIISPKKEEGPEWIIPEILYNDDRLKLALPQLAKRVNPNITIRSLPSHSINITHTGRVILPCVAASRIGSDLQAAVQKAALVAVAPIVLIFNHLAPHMSRIRTATKDRLSDRKLVNSCQDMIDVVYWNQSMYECQANTKAVQQLSALWNIKNGG